MTIAQDPSQLQNLEPLWLGLLIAALLFYPLLALRDKLGRRWLEPPIILGVVFCYYTVIGPLKSLHDRDWIDRMANLRHGFEIAWFGALLAFVAFLVGYAVIPQKLVPPQRFSGLGPAQSWRIGQQLNICALSAFALVKGPSLLGLLTPLAVNKELSSGYDLGILQNYGAMAVNLLVPGSLLMLAGLMKGRGSPLTVGSWVGVAILIYSSLGFRYRLVLLLAPMALLWLLTTRRKPNIPLTAGIIVLMIFVSGVMALSRSYGSGLDLSKLANYSLVEIFLHGFQDSVTFMTSGGVMAATPHEHPFYGLEPLKQALLYPIPQALLPGKNSNEYLYNALHSVYLPQYSSGAAFLNYAEYYMMAGWWSLVAIYAILGMTYRRLWLWMEQRQNEPLALVIYVVSVCYLFMVVSRGYMPQVAMLFGFSAAPLFVIYRFTSRSAPISANLARSIKKVSPILREKLRLRSSRTSAVR